MKRASVSQSNRAFVACQSSALLVQPPLHPRHLHGRVPAQLFPLQGQRQRRAPLTRCGVPTACSVPAPLRAPAQPSAVHPLDCRRSGDPADILLHIDALSEEAGPEQLVPAPRGRIRQLSLRLSFALEAADDPGNLLLVGIFGVVPSVEVEKNLPHAIVGRLADASGRLAELAVQPSGAQEGGEGDGGGARRPAPVVAGLR